MNKAVKITLGLILVGSAVFAQSLADARKAIDAEQYQKGKAILNTLTSTQPANADNFFFLGNLYLTTSPIYVRPDYIDSAKAAFSKGITANGEYALNHVGLGAVELAKKGSPKANFDKAISLTKKKDHTTDLYIGRAYVNAPVPMINEGLVHLEKSKLLNDKDAQLYLVLGDAYRSQQKNGEAFSAYRNAFELDKTFLRSKVELGKINKLSKAFPEAIAEFNSVIALDPSYGPAYRELAETYFLRYLAYSAFENGNFASSAQALKEFISKVEPSRLISQDYLYLGRAQMKDTTMFTEGLSNITKAVEMDSTNAAVMSEIGQALFKGKKYEAAAKAYEISIKNPERALLDYYYLGSSYYFNYGALKNANMNPEKDLLVKADSSFSYLLQRAPTTQIGWQYRGRINRLMDDENDSQGLAAPFYARYVNLVTVEKPELATKSTPGLIEAYNYLGSVAARKDGDNVKAKEFFDKVLALDPVNVTATQAVKAIEGNK